MGIYACRLYVGSIYVYSYAAAGDCRFAFCQLKSSLHSSPLQRWIPTPLPPCLNILLMAPTPIITVTTPIRSHRAIRLATDFTNMEGNFHHTM